MSAADGTGRLEALRGLLRTLTDSTHGRAADQMIAAGELLRRTRALELEPSQVEGALRELPPPVVESWLRDDPCKALEASLRRALEEAAEAALGEDAEERQVWAASAYEALLARDRAESARVALGRWESLTGAVVAGSEEFRAHLSALDGTFAARARWLVGLNARRRLERDLLDDGERDAAWWFTRRVDCDDLLNLLAGTAVPDGHAHLTQCTLCRDDLERSRLVERPPQRHLTSDDAWKLDLGLLSARERTALREHADRCTACTQVLHAISEGDQAIEEAMGWDEGAPAARRSEAQRRPADRARRVVVEERREFRLSLIRDRGRVRVLVEPREVRGFAVATLTLPPQRSVLTPKHTDEGLEFDLGDEQELQGRTARLQLQITEGSQPISKDIAL